MKKIFLMLTVGLFAGLLSSCATIMRDNNQVIPINASTEKVQIKVTDQKGITIFEGQTPTVVNLKAAGDGYFDPRKYTVVASKDGFATQTQIIDWNVSGWYIFGNLLFGGLIGYLIVDPISGDMYYLDEDPVHFNMTPMTQIK